MVDVEERSLCALEHDQVTGIQTLVHDPRRVGDVGLEPVPVRQVLLRHRLQIERRILGVGTQ